MARTRSDVTAPPRTHDPEKRPALGMVVAAACTGQFLVVLDVSVINVALPSVRADLGLGGVALQWVVNAYILTFAGFLLIGGRAADLYGRKRMFVVGLGVFTAASLAGGLAQESWQLIGARAVQGVGGAVLAPATLSLITSSLPEGPVRTRAIGTWTAVGAGGGAVGALIGGVLTQYLSWRWVLLVNVPVGALVIVAATLRLVESRAPASRRLDLPGAVLITLTVGALAYGVVRTESSGWVDVTSLGPLILGLVGLVLFLVVEARTRQPLMPLGLFRRREVSAANVAMLLCGSGTFAMWYFMSLHMQNVLGYSALATGLAFLPHTTSIIVGSKLLPRLMPQVDSRLFAIVGASASTIGLFWQAAVLTVDGAYVWTIAAPGVLVCCGTGLLLASLTTVATAGAAVSDTGLVAGLITTSRQIGGTLGLALLSTIAASGTAGAHGGGAAALATGYRHAFGVAAWAVLASVVVMVTALPRARTTAGARAGKAEDPDA